MYDIMPTPGMRCGFIYLPWNILGEITVGRALELAGVLGPVIHNLNISRLYKYKHREKKANTQWEL